MHSRFESDTPITGATAALTATNALRSHWPEYLIEAVGLGMFMLVAGIAGTVLESPQSTLHDALPSPLLRRALMGLAMGLTAAALVYSRWGKRSGAHFNPALTLTFLYVGKVRRWDALFYVAAQFVGGTIGVLLVYALLGNAFAQPPVSFIVTVPGRYGIAAACAGESCIAFGLMLMILFASNHPRWTRYTGLLCGLLIAAYVTFEAPFSGMSMNPARTFASALPAGIWSAAWIYFTVPLIGMLAAVHVYRRLSRDGVIACAKLNHAIDVVNVECAAIECIFICDYQQRAGTRGRN